MVFASFVMKEDERSPVSNRRLGEVIDAFDRFGDRSKALLDMREQRAEADRQADKSSKERWATFQPVLDLARFGRDARSLELVEGVAEKIDAGLKERKAAIEVFDEMIESLIKQLTPERFPADLLREVLNTTIRFQVREHDDLVNLYYALLATAAEVDPDNQTIPRLDGEASDDYLARVLAD